MIEVIDMNNMNEERAVEVGSGRRGAKADSS